MKVKSTVKLNMGKIKQLTRAQITALEHTAEALHTAVAQAEVMPRDTGTMQNESTFVDYSKSEKGRVTIATSTPYARRLYFHPEYHFQKWENAFAQGKWYDPWIDGVWSNFCEETFVKLYKKLAGI